MKRKRRNRRPTPFPWLCLFGVGLLVIGTNVIVCHFLETEGLHWPPLNGLIVTTVGAGLLFVGVWKLLAARRRERLLLQYPDQPWRADGERWKDLTIRAHSLRTVIACWAIGIFLALWASPAFIYLASAEILQRTFYFLILPALFALIALRLIGRAVYLTLQYLKYGDPVLVLSQLPIVPGLQFVAVLHVKTHIVAEHGVQLTFKCVKETTTGSGKSQSVDSKDLHSEIKIVTKDMARIMSEGSVIPVVFDVPAGMHDRKSEGNPTYEWTLEVTAKTPGIDFSATFDDLPVYTVADQSLVNSPRNSQLPDPPGSIPQGRT